MNMQVHPLDVVRIDCHADRTLVWRSDGSPRVLHPGETLVHDDNEGVSKPGRAGALTAEAIESYLKDHCAHATLATTAAHFCCHPNSVTRVLRRADYPAFQALLTRIRMDRAEQLLRAGGMSVTQTAQSCGYKNMTHFYKVFCKYYGRTPGEVRREALLP